MPLQFESVERGGTDAGRFHVTGQGVPCISMGVAARYIHSHVSIIDRRDFESTVKLLVALVKRLDRKTVDAFELRHRAPRGHACRSAGSSSTVCSPRPRSCSTSGAGRVRAGAAGSCRNACCSCS